MTKKKTKENKILLLLFLLCICFSFSNYLILTKDNTPFHYDILDSYLLSKKLYNSFTTFGVSGLFYSIANDYDKDYPILFILQPFPFFYVFGVFEDSAAFSNIPYIFILIFSTYFIGKELKNKKAGFIACLILLFISGILSFSRVYLPVFPLTSIFMLSVFIFLRTKNFKKTNYSFGLGIIAALGLLIKYTFVLYLFPFVFSFLLENLITNIKKKNKLIEEIQIKNFFYFVCTFLTISILGYLSFSSSSAFINSKSAWPSVLGYLSIAHTTFGSGNIITYIFKVSYEFIKRSNILFLGIYPLIILSFIYSLYTTLKNKILRPLIMCVCLSFFLVIYIGPVPRFILPLVPLLIILLSINFVEIYNYLKKKKRLEKFNFNHFVLTVLVFIILLFSIGLIKEKKKNHFQDVYFKGILSPSSEFKSLKNITQDIKLVSKNNSEILILQDSPIMHALNYRLNNDFIVHHPFFCLSDPATRKSDIECNTSLYLNENKLCSFDIILHSNKYMRTQQINEIKLMYKERLEVLNQILVNFENCKTNYSLFSNYSNVPLQYNETSNILIYVKN